MPTNDGSFADIILAAIIGKRQTLIASTDLCGGREATRVPTATLDCCSDGKMVLLTHLLEGQEATVLQLPAQPATAAEAKAQERVFAPQLFSSFS